MKNFKLLFYPVLFTIITAFIPPFPDEGMYPLSEIRKLDLKEAGLRINIDEVYNPDGVSLVDALVNVGGCTGSFISEEGLMITNHHCSFGAVQSISTTEDNYLENGFLAKNRSEELPAAGLKCRITVSYEDVSAEVLKAAGNAADISKRTEAINEKIKEIIKREEEKDTTIEAQVSEMFTGESYILFRYKMINDVRLVYIPPRNIGEFGGESDNWVWPRHTGDFAFLRAYVAPDGSPADYSKENIPFTPKKYLKVNPDGVKEGDFVFILGYPGRTFKNQPSWFIEYQEKYQLPFIQDLYEYMINLYKDKGAEDPEFELEISTKVKSLANVEKNYRGKLQGLDRLNIVERKRAEEQELQKYIDADPELKNKYGSTIPEIKKVYDEIFSFGMLPFITRALSQQVSLYRLAEILIQNEIESAKPESERKELYTSLGKERLTNTIDALFANMRPELDRQILIKILSEAGKHPETQSLVDVEGISNLTSEINEMFKSTIIRKKSEYLKLLKSASLKDVDDPFIDLVKHIEKAEDVYDKKMPELQGKLNIHLAEFMDAKRSWQNKAFIPDANNTLRLTYGYIRGYSPADATSYYPVTTLKGLIEKGTDEGDYELNKKIAELYRKKDFGKFKDDRLNDVPVALLYNTDTSGGNSGSPILDAYGNLIGVNFDRAFEATINDYAWSEDYSRSIGVDIRYVLWVTQKIGGADFLLKELGVL
jgi:hypothetical protein